MVILHLSFDYPDAIDSKKTKAIRNLINTQKNVKNVVFSLNRTAVKLNKTSVLKEGHGYTLYTWGLPYGVLLYFWMFVAYRRILKVLRQEGIKPDMIHAHKLASEGIIAFFLSKRLKVPYVLSIRSSDLHVLRFKRLYRSIYRRVVKKAIKVIFIAPWALKPLQAYLGEEHIKNKSEVLPNIINLDFINGSVHTGSRKFVCVMHLKYLKAKNIERNIQAFDIVFDKYPTYSLDIIGDGPRRSEVHDLLGRTRNPKNFVMRGEIEHSILIKSYADYLGLVLPSYPETFGLVFIEALSAGIPVVYSKNAGIDGYFDDFNVAISVNHRDIQGIARAIERIIEQNIEFKKNVEEMVKSGYLNKFSKEVVGEHYSKIIEKVSERNLTNLS